MSPFRHLVCCCALLAFASIPAAHAARFVLEASNPGAISGNGRDLSFDIPQVSGEIQSAQLVLNLNYSNARELSVSMIDGSGFVILPIAPRGAILTSGKTMNGRYRITDSALTTWALSSEGLNFVPTHPVRAYQLGLGGQCINLLARYLEFDINRKAPLTLRIERLQSVNPGSGSISSAQLIIDTSVPDEILAASFDEPDTSMVPCRPPSVNVVLNGQTESPTRSNLTIVNSTSGSAPLRWYFRDFENQDFGPIEFGLGRHQVYVGRFGGRNRLNIGYWDEETGTVTFTTGAGDRTIALPGDWVNTFHQIIPGDYDGDGTTDVALAFLGQFAGQLRWFARIRFSRSAEVVDYLIDPRAFIGGTSFTSSNIGFGAGQDADRNGVDELTMYVESSAGNMHNVQIVFEQQRRTGIFTTAWGLLGDRQILGRWTANTSGNQFGLMVVRTFNPPADAREWFLFPNTGIAAGFSTDIPMSFNFDADALNEIAVYRPSDRRAYLIPSTGGANVVTEPLGGSTGFNTPIGFIQGTIAPLAQ
jgi:hypothetical protein